MKSPDQARAAEDWKRASGARHRRKKKADNERRHTKVRNSEIGKDYQQLKRSSSNRIDLVIVLKEESATHLAKSKGELNLTEQQQKRVEYC